MNLDTIGRNHPPYMVAEISGNHGGSLGRMLDLIAAAKDHGADAVKFQLYKPEDLATPGSKYWDIYQQCQVPLSWLHPMYEMARHAEITLFASPFARWAVDELEKYNCPAYKIASPEVKNRQLVDYCVRTGKPIIVSTGALGPWDQFPAADVLLHCVAQYPTKIEDANLGAIRWLQRNASPRIGFSDHTPGITAPIAAVALGACMIEKHFKIDDNCVDAEFSLGPQEFKAMVQACKSVQRGYGPGVPQPTCGERELAA